MLTAGPRKPRPRLRPLSASPCPGGLWQLEHHPRRACQPDHVQRPRSHLSHIRSCLSSDDSQYRILVRLSQRELEIAAMSSWAASGGRAFRAAPRFARAGDLPGGRVRDARGRIAQDADQDPERSGPQSAAGPSASGRPASFMIAKDLVRTRVPDPRSQEPTGGGGAVAQSRAAGRPGGDGQLVDTPSREPTP